jgi:hypothetical protein
MSYAHNETSRREKEGGIKSATVFPIQGSGDGDREFQLLGALRTVPALPQGVLGSGDLSRQFTARARAR